MDHLVELYRPELRDPILLAAFAGWNDAAEVATGSLRYLTRHWHAEACAEIDPEEFFVFTDTRPQVRVVDSHQRRVTWPQNQFYHARPPGSARDYLLLIGTEPNLRWKTFTRTVLDYATGLGVSLVINLGGLLADVLHTRPAVITGSIADPALASKVASLGIHRSRYEGPTGIVGVLGDVCRQRGIVSGSIWGNVPHYIGSMTNPPVSAALLSTMGELLDLKVDLGELNRAAIRFNAQVSTAIANDSDVSAYIRQLEERERQKADEESQAAESSSTTSELPSPDVVVRELEEFLRRSKEGDAD